MKKTTIISLLTLLGFTQGFSQEYEYVPFVREGVKWVYGIVNYRYNYVAHDPAFLGETVYRILELKGDTVINGKTYKAMHKYSGKSINYANDTVPIYLREENKLVYGIIPDKTFYNDCPIYNGYSSIDMYSGEEFLLYDFQDPVSYWNNLFAADPAGCPNQYLYTDTITIGNRKAKRYVNQLFNVRDWYMIEGIGIDDELSYTLAFFQQISGIGSLNFVLSHVIEDGKIIYKGIQYDPDNMTAVDEVATDKSRQTDGNYYNLMGQPMGKEVPTTPGIYIHHGKKIVVR